jgi:hypothetical protein
MDNEKKACYRARCKCRFFQPCNCQKTGFVPRSSTIDDEWSFSSVARGHLDGRGTPGCAPCAGWKQTF